MCLGLTEAIQDLVWGIKEQGARPGRVRSTQHKGLRTGAPRCKDGNGEELHHLNGLRDSFRWTNLRFSIHVRTGQR